MTCTAFIPERIDLVVRKDFNPNTNELFKNTISLFHNVIKIRKITKQDKERIAPTFREFRTLSWCTDHNLTKYTLSNFRHPKTLMLLL